VTRRVKRGIKRRETDPDSNQIPKFLHSERHPERFTELHGEEKREAWCAAIPWDTKIRT